MFKKIFNSFINYKGYILLYLELILLGSLLIFQMYPLYSFKESNIISNDVYVEYVSNDVKVGKLEGDRNLSFGLKNILEEFLQDKGYNIDPNSPNKLHISIIYLDVLTTKKNISVFHKNEEEVVIRLKGTLYNNTKKIKEVLVEESSSEISMSTLIVDEGGKFNQVSLSNALKKGSDKLITKLFDNTK